MASQQNIPTLKSVELGFDDQEFRTVRDQAQARDEEAVIDHSYG